MNPNLKTAPKTKKTIPLKKIIAAVLLLTLCGSGYAAYQAHNNNQKKQQVIQADRARFALVEWDMAAAYKSMINVAGQPSVTNNGKSCSYTSVKYGLGDLSCGIYYQFGYVNGIVRNAQEIKTAIDKTSNSRMRYDKEIQYSPGYKRVALKTNNDIKCWVEARSGNQLNTDTFAIDHKLSLVYFFDCESRTTEPIYTLAE